MARLFGTDGVRGIANADLSCELAMKIGAAGASVLTSAVHNPRILVGTDTRLSADMLRAAVTAGICSVGGDVIDVGVMPTPAMAYLVRLYDADAAVMISASHNTMEYNGIKWFNGDGYKLSDEIEDEIERMVCSDAEFSHPTGSQVGHVVSAKRAREEYKEFLKSAADGRYDGIKLMLDCANGASSGIAYEVFSELGAEVTSRADEPDGNNINDMCGSLHPERLQEMVSGSDADVGFAFDGDADRLIATDELGNVVDGDRIMGVCAIDMKRRGALNNDTLVVTVMSNIGLISAMKEHGIALEVTSVGDRYVLERMRQGGFSLGGEQSGHLIFLDKCTTGDGMLSAIQLLNVIKRTGSRMSQLVKLIPIYPQVLVNVIVEQPDKLAVVQDADLGKCVAEIESELADSGRVLIRPSGTEPLVRLMLEGKDETQLREYAVRMAHILEQKYGAVIKN